MRIARPGQPMDGIVDDIADDIEEPPVTSLERWVEARARGLLGAGVWLARRTVTTRAGGRRGRLVVGFQICGPAAGGEGDGEVLGMSPPRGVELDLSNLGNPEQALEDALQRRADGRGAYRGEIPGAPPVLGDPGADGGRPRLVPPRPTSEFTTSTLTLPVP